MSQNEEAYLLERRCNEEIESVVRLTVAAGAKLSKDGNRWCYLLGDNLQEGIAGFGESPYEAAQSFNDAYFRLEIRTPSTILLVFRLGRGSLDLHFTIVNNRAAFVVAVI